MIRLLTLLFLPTIAIALEPGEVFLLVNKNVPASKELAEYYCKQRAVPVENIITLDLVTTEDISRKDYNERIVAPVREVLKDRKEKAKVLLSIHGVPLRVGGEEPSAEDKVEIKAIEVQIAKQQTLVRNLQAEIAATELQARAWPLTWSRPSTVQAAIELKTQQTVVLTLSRRRVAVSRAESQACVDNELMMLWWNNYRLARFQNNLLHWQATAAIREGKQPFIMTCRLDGPTPAIAKGLVDQAIAVEKKGLDGTVYVDARGIKFNPKNEDGYGYGGYDESMREMAKLLKDEGKMKVVLDDRTELFAPNSCPDCALYCGWYSHANFIDSNRFVPGAIAWHLASSEAVSLRRPDVKFWCKNLLEKGAAATIGPVAEPYTVGFPKPAEFFGMLATGKYTLVECYAKTLLLSSWMTVLIGDPLYTPFAKNPRIQEEQVQSSPKFGKPFFEAK